MSSPLTRSELLAASAGLLLAAVIAVSSGPEGASKPPVPQSSPEKNTTQAPAQGKPSSRQETAPEGVKNPPSSKETSPISFATELNTLLAQPPGPLRAQAIETLIARWAQVDGPAAVVAAGTFTEPALRFLLRETAFSRWAERDPQAAWDYATLNPQRDLPPERFGHILRGLGGGDIATALAFLAQHPQGALRQNMPEIGEALDQLYQRGGHSKILPWLGQLADGPLKDAATHRLIDQWARYEPSAAARWMEAQANFHGENITAGRKELASSWADVNPLQALDYFNQLPADQRQDTYYERIFKRWLDSDKNAAAAYLADLPSGPALDRPIEQYAYDIMQQNPELTMPWVESITDPRRRWKAITRVAAVWKEQNPAALAAYVEGAAFLNAQQKQQLLAE